MLEYLKFFELVTLSTQDLQISSAKKTAFMYLQPLTANNKTKSEKNSTGLKNVQLFEVFHHLLDVINFSTHDHDYIFHYRVQVDQAPSEDTS